MMRPMPLWLEAIRLLLVFACIINFSLHQMDLKSNFFNGYIEKEIYVEQPPGFVDFDHPNHVYKLKNVDAIGFDVLMMIMMMCCN